MVKMNMTEEDEIDRLGRNRKRRPIPLEISPFLKKPTIDEQLEASRFDEKTGPGDLLGGA